MRKRSGARLLVILLILIVLGGIGGLLYFQRAYHTYLVTPADSESSARVNFTVEKGQTGKTIAENLATLELIPSEWAFYKYIKDEEIAPKIEAGKFVLKKSYTIPEIAEFLTKSRSDEIVVTIREGLTVQQVDAYLSENNILPETSFIECAKNCTPTERLSILDSKPADQNYEGYLFPDTYFVDPETVTPQGLFNRMLGNFEKKLDSELRSQIAQRGYSIHQIVTMASLIEKESRNDDEKAIISGILWKRLEEGITLGVDATVRFALNKWTEPLTVDDLDIDSPYNTRRFGGLPPGPISNFSVSSLRAAVNPEASEYYYYLHDPSGRIHYGKTNAEHNENKERYL